MDTIAAVATPPGAGGIGIVRVSGPGALSIARRLFGGPVSISQVHFGAICDLRGALLDEGLLLAFAAPHSYTGEDAAEFHCHGGPFVVRAVLSAVLDGGARLAQPGEFTRRAFENGRIDLTQAEAVADLIAAGSREAVMLAARGLRGDMKQRVEDLRQRLIDALAPALAAIDYPDEMDEVEVLPQCQKALEDARLGVSRLLGQFDAGRRLREGVRVVLAGAPNAGKSSLFNALLGEDRAIVTDQAGTTRDTLEEGLMLGGVRFQLIDTAGLRRAVEVVEAAGVDRAERALGGADAVLWVYDGAKGPSEDEGERLSGLRVPLIRVATKIDLAPPRRPFDVAVSAVTGQGLAQLRDDLSRRFPAEPDALTGNVRHQRALLRSLECIEGALAVEADLAIVVQEGYGAAEALGEITGQSVHDDVLDAIFHRFCLGK